MIDPSMELAKLLGEFKLTRRDRVEAEKLLWREVVSEDWEMLLGVFV